MALFKVFKGGSAQLANQTKVDGYCWFTYDNGKFYIDYKINPNDDDEEVKRQPLNAEQADKDSLGNLIYKAYAAELDLSGHTLQLLAKDRTVLDTITLPDTTYTFANGTNGSFTVTPAGGQAQTVSIGKPATAGTADSVAWDGITDKPDTYTPPTAANSTLGGIKTNYAESGKNYAVKVDSNGNAYVSVPWTDNNTTYTFDGTYNASTNKAATVSTVTNAINALGVNDITGFGPDKTLATLTETNGKIAATFQNIEITKSQVSDFPTQLSDFTNDSGFTSNSASSTSPKMDGIAAVGSETAYARGDHVHPTDTSRAPTNHASSDTTYGTGNSSNYGHLKLSAATNSTSGVNGGIAATPSAVKAAYDLAASKTSNTGTVTSVQVAATSPVVSSQDTAQSGTLSTTISLADTYGDTKNPYGTKTANTVLAGPSFGSEAAPAFRSLVAADIPSLTISKISDFPTDVSSFTNDMGYLTSSTDYNVRQTNDSSTNANYRLLLSNSDNDTQEDNISRKNANLIYNPSTNKLSTGNLDLTGELDVVGNAYLHNQTTADNLSAGSLIVTGNTSFTNIPTAPTATAGDSSSKLATTEFVSNSVAGLSGAMHFIGIATSAMTDGQTAPPTVSGQTSYTPAAGDVVLAKDSADTSSNKRGEFVFTGLWWELLGDEGSYALRNELDNYVTTDDGVTNVAWDNINKKLTQTIDTETSNILEFVQGSNITLTAESGKITIAGTNDRDPGYGKITPAGDTGTSSVTANTTSIIAGTHSETFTFKTGNKWLTVAGTQSATNNSDVLTIGHALSGITAGTVGTSSATSGITLAVPYVTYDAAGHITETGTHTHTVPAMTASANGVGRITKGTGISVSYSSGNVTVTNSATDTLTGSPAASKTITAFNQVNGGVQATFADIAIAGSQITSGEIAFGRLPNMYWADTAVASAASYKTTPEVATIKLNGNTGATAASTKNVVLQYDSTLEVLNFVFS